MAFYEANTGYKIEKELSALLWPDRTKSAQYQNMKRLKNGQTLTFTSEMVQTICKVCMVDANFLFNIN